MPRPSLGWSEALRYRRAPRANATLISTTWRDRRIGRAVRAERDCRILVMSRLRMVRGLRDVIEESGE